MAMTKADFLKKAQPTNVNAILSLTPKDKLTGSGGVGFSFVGKHLMIIDGQACEVQLNGHATIVKSAGWQNGDLPENAIRVK